MSAIMSVEELTRKLVAYNTVSSPVPGQSTREIADFASNILEAGGFKVMQFPYYSKIPDKKADTDKEQVIEKVNIVALKGGSEPLFGLSGHMDVVPVAGWKVKSKPFEMIQSEDRFYGRGVADMKLFLAISMIAGSRISSHTLKQPFGIYLTSDEEVGCVGVRQLFGHEPEIESSLSDTSIELTSNDIAPVPRYVIIGEPTGLMPINLHKGYMFLEIKIEVISRRSKKDKRHSSNPDGGHSVIKHGLPEVLQALNRLEADLRGIKDDRFKIPFPTINPGIVRMGDGAAKNVLAPLCFIDIEVRNLPGQDPRVIVDLVRDIVQRSLAGIEWIQATVKRMRAPTLPMETSFDSKITYVVREISGEKDIQPGVAYNTEGGTFNKHGSESIIFGPGSIDQAHSPSEFVLASYFEDRVVVLYQDIIRMLCC